MDDQHIIVYSLSTCGHCRDTISFMRNKGVDFSFIDIDLLEKEERKKVLEDIKKINPEISFPTTVAKGKTVVGYNEEQLEEALNS